MSVSLAVSIASLLDIFSLFQVHICIAWIKYLTFVKPDFAFAVNPEMEHAESYIGSNLMVDVLPV